MQRLSIIAIFLLVSLPSLAQVPVAIVFGSGCPEPGGAWLADSFGEGSQPCGTGDSLCNTTWVTGGAGATGITLQPTGIALANVCANAVQIAKSGSPAYMYTAGTMPQVDLSQASQTVDQALFIELVSNSLPNSTSVQLAALTAASTGSSYAVRLMLNKTSGGVLQFQGGGSTLTAGINIAQGTWYAVVIHGANGTGASSISVYDASSGAQVGSAQTFTANTANLIQYATFSTSTDTRTLTYRIGGLNVVSSQGGGPPPSLMVDLEPGNGQSITDGLTLTTAILRTIMHGGSGTWTQTGTALTADSDGQMSYASTQGVVVAGTRYTDTGGSFGMAVDMGATTHPYFTFTPATVYTARWAMSLFWKSDLDTADATNHYSSFSIAAGAVCTMHIFNGQLLLQDTQGAGYIPYSANTPYYVTLELVNGGACTLHVYDAASCAEVLNNGGGSGLTYSQTFGTPTSFNLGRVGADSGFANPAGKHQWFDNIVLDHVTGVPQPCTRS